MRLAQGSREAYKGKIGQADETFQSIRVKRH
jgi:hypothetical protein